MSAKPSVAVADIEIGAMCHFRNYAGKNVQAGALPINHIALRRRTLTPSAWGASASRREATAAETTCAGWLRSQLHRADFG